LKPSQQAGNAKKAPRPKEKKKGEGLAAFIPDGARAYWAVGGSVLLITTLLFLFSGSTPEEKAFHSAPQTAQTGPATPPASPGSPNLNTAPVPDRPAFSGIRILPLQPTRLDTLKADIATGTDTGKKRTYTYRWKINDKTVEGATGDTLKSDRLKKRDMVTVTATPHEGDQAGFPLESPIISIHSASPILELKAASQKRKVGESIEMQLLASDPDGDAVTFSLEVPTVEGMIIDKTTGKITWRPRPDQRGKIRFGAAAEDTDKTKVTKVFEVMVE